MNIFDSQIQYLRNSIFDYPLIKHIDDDLILLSIIHPQSSINESLKNRLIKKYKSANYDRIEFLGDSVLELLISDLIFSKNIINVGQMSRIRSVIVRNVSLVCLMNDRKLCDLNDTVKKSCADIFEAILGAVYIHLSQYDVNPIKIMIQWMIDVWNIDNIIDYIINHPNDENICIAIQRSYDEFLSLETPDFGYIKNNYERLQKVFEYYRLGPVELIQNFDQRTRLWTIKVICPMTLGCQFYNNIEGNKRYLSIQSNHNKQQAIEDASNEAIDIILNDYQLI